MPTGVMGAMVEEVDSLIAAMDVVERGTAGRREWWRGALGGRDVVLVHSHWGKVAAASTATWLVTAHAVDRILFTGVAGALDPALRVGDVVVASETVQHDMDARPILPRHEIPLLGTSVLATDEAGRAALERAARAWLDESFETDVDAATRERFALDRPRVMLGGVASGDRFVHAPGDAEELRARLPGALCVEMEGAAVAQVCAAFDVPFTLLRTISDAADAGAPVDFPAFVEQVARRYALGIVTRWLEGVDRA